MKQHVKARMEREHPTADTFMERVVTVGAARLRRVYADDVLADHLDMVRRNTARYLERFGAPDNTGTVSAVECCVRWFHTHDAEH